MKTRIKTFSQYLGEKNNISDSLQYHIANELSIVESIFRPGSKAHLSILSEARKFYELELIKLSKFESNFFKFTDLGLYGEYEGNTVPLDLPLEILTEASGIYQGKKVTLDKPQRNKKKGKKEKKYEVHVKNPKSGKVIKIKFGDIKGGLTAKVSDPKARKSFAARHNCKDKKDKTKAGYWACRINRYAHLWGGKTYPGYW